MTTGIVLPAHMGSTRFPGKPLADVGGRPLLSYAVEAARESGLPFVVAAYYKGDDQEIGFWCSRNGVQYLPSPSGIRNGTERAAAANRELKWDRVIVFQCDEPDVTGHHLRGLKCGEFPCTLITHADESDWGNTNSVFVGLPPEISGDTPEVAMYFVRGVENRGRHHMRHVGAYLYDSELLDRYLHHGPSPYEERYYLEQLRTMAMGYAWNCRTVLGPLRSINVPADVEKFTEDAREPISQS